MNTGEKLLLGVGVIVGVSLLRKKSALQNIIFNPGNVVGLSMSGPNPVIQISIIAQNTSDQQLIMQSLAGNVTAGGTLIGNISSFSTQSIPPNSQVPILVNLKLYSLGIVNDLISVFLNKNAVGDINVNGFANVGFFQVPLNMKFSLGL